MRFVHSEVEDIVHKAVEAVLGQNPYEHEKSHQWAKEIIETVLERLMKLSKPYKYVVNCTIVQKTGGGLYNASSCYWDSTKDDDSGDKAVEAFRSEIPRSTNESRV
ncbi:Flagellar outer arm dynein light chain [Fasciolopsis buskii]|uniref:Flagellar outer arm dynein light chain n=1 Tax=Fasciolopsis buskii TaxID=27845 RepID=A0A8E0RUP9_9TREM|nr:Flagellar outer arm dynein light chain [Fasciolopsis buski]